jgi:hypothetical protein
VIRFITGVVGFAVAAVPPAALLLLTAGPVVRARDLLFWAAIFYGYSLFFACILGAPLFLVLLRFSLVRLWSAALAGLLVGVVVLIVLSLPFDPTRSGNVKAMGLFGLTGALSGSLFWLIWRTGATPHSSKSDVV